MLHTSVHQQQRHQLWLPASRTRARVAIRGDGFSRNPRVRASTARQTRSTALGLHLATPVHITHSQARQPHVTRHPPRSAKRPARTGTRHTTRSQAGSVTSRGTCSRSRCQWCWQRTPQGTVRTLSGLAGSRSGLPDMECTATCRVDRRTSLQGTACNPCCRLGRRTDQVCRGSSLPGQPPRSGCRVGISRSSGRRCCSRGWWWRGVAQVSFTHPAQPAWGRRQHGATY